MAYTYSSFVSALSTETGIPALDANFQAALPQLIDDAEQRIYRDLDLVSTSVAVNGTATPNARLFSIPQGSGHIIVVDAINAYRRVKVDRARRCYSADVCVNNSDYIRPGRSCKIECCV